MGNVQNMIPVQNCTGFILYISSGCTCTPLRENVVWQEDGWKQMQSQYWIIPNALKGIEKKSNLLAQIFKFLFFQLFGDAQEMGCYNERKRSFASKVCSQVILSA